jgi:RNA polymerase sigma factor (sigma-70 family)
MNGHSLGAAVRRLRDTLGGPAGSDAALLDRFAADRDPAAFAGLVARYGPVVLGVCRRVIGDPHLAEDVFQAVFLVLARKAGSIRKRDAVGSWLYGVAYRLARKARNRSRFAPAPQNVSEPVDPAATAAWNDLLAALDHELQRLPDKLRAPLLLCYYDACTQDEAARRLGWSLGTLRRRLDQARDLLRVRMTARGATLGAGLLATVLATRGARAAVSGILSRTTIDTAGTFASGGHLAGTAAQLAEEGLRMLAASKVRAGVALAVLVGGLAVGSGALFGVGRDQPVAKDSPPVAHAPGSPDPSLPAGVVLRHGGAPFRHSSEIINVLVTPDGKTILTQGERTVRLWDAATGEDRGVLELPDEGLGFWTASLTPDGQTLLTTRHNGTAQVWDISGRKMMRSFRLAAPPFDVAGAKCVHSPDGKAIAVVTQDGSIRVCDVAAGKEMDQLRSHSDVVVAAVFTPDSKQIVLARVDALSVIERNLATGMDVGKGGQILTLAAPAVNLTFSPNGKWLAGACVSGKGNDVKTIISYVDWINGGVSPVVGGNSLADRLLAYSPDGRYLFAPDLMSEGRILTQWDLGTNRAIRQYPGDREVIGALTFTSDRKTLITAGTGLRFWDWTNGRELRAANSGGDRCYALSADGKALAEAGAAGVISVWDTTAGKALHRFEPSRPAAGASLSITAIAVSPDGQLLAARGSAMPPDITNEQYRRSYIWVWDLKSEQLLHRLDGPSPSPKDTLTFGPDSKTLVAAGDGGRMAWVDAVTGGPVENPGLNSQQVAFSTDGRRVVSWEGSNGFVVPNKGPSGPSVRGQSPRETIRFSPWTGDGQATVVTLTSNGEWAAGGGTDRGATGSITVVSTSGKPGWQIRNLSRPVVQVALTLDGKIVAAALDGESSPVLVFDVETGRELKRFTGLHGQAAWLAFAPDGKRLYAASTDTTVLAWEMP